MEWSALIVFHKKNFQVECPTGEPKILVHEDEGAKNYDSSRSSPETKSVSELLSLGDSEKAVILPNYLETLTSINNIFPV